MVVRTNVRSRLIWQKIQRGDCSFRQTQRNGTHSNSSRKILRVCRRSLRTALHWPSHCDTIPDSIIAGPDQPRVLPTRHSPHQTCQDSAGLRLGRKPKSPSRRRWSVGQRMRRYRNCDKRLQKSGRQRAAASRGVLAVSETARAGGIADFRIERFRRDRTIAVRRPARARPSCDMRNPSAFRDPVFNV
jgi:hypothetical protein